MKKNALIALFAFAIAGFSLTSCSDSDDAPVTQDPIENPNPDPNPNPNPNPVTTRYQHRVLIEDATGTWCQFCPRVSYGIEQAKSNATHGDNVVAVAIHHSNYDTYPDPMQISANNSLVNMFANSYGLEGFPFGLINRTAVWDYPEPNNLAQVFNSINQQGSPVGIKISSNLTTSGGTITADFKFSEGYQNLKYTVYVIENGVITPSSPQSNTTGYYNGEGANFVHNDVLRAASGTVTGNTLGTVTAGQSITKDNQSVEYTLFNNDLSKVEVVVFVTDASGKVLNVKAAHANQTADFEIVN